MPLDPTEIPVNANLSKQDRDLLNRLNREREEESSRIILGQAFATVDKDLREA